MKKLFTALLLVSALTEANAQQAFEFNGTNQYITFGTAAGLGSNTFTLECWFYKKGTGSTTTSGTRGIATIVPIISKGRGEADGDNRDMNYIFGINTANGFLCADFEEGAGQPSIGLNHPVQGTTVIANNTWYHAAVSFDGAKWRIYLNGNLETTDSIGVLPRSNSIQHAGIATAMTSTGTAQGYFQGIIDEVRIWNYARTTQEIRDSINKQVITATGLVGRWAMDDVSGTTLTGTGTSGINGTRTNTPTPVGTGAPYNITFTPPNNPPAQPTAYLPIDSNWNYMDSILQVTVTDPDTNNMKVTFMGRPHDPLADSSKFTILPIPDTQFYTSHLNGATNEIFKAQTRWIRDSIKAKNIVYAIQLGDCVQNGDNGGNDIEWKRADTSFKIIEDPATTLLPYGLPYGICVGNHDQSPGGSASGTTTFYNQYFGSSRFTGRNYYGGHYGTNNDNHYQLFTAIGLNFIAINLEYDTNADTSVLRWADSLLKAYPNHRGIISSHWIINADASWGAQGQAIYNRVKTNPNLFLMLCGHINPGGEARRTDTYNGNTVTTLLSDYQDLTSGGNGWLRIMEFNPYNYSNTVSVKTYSPTLNQYQTDANSQFTFKYQITGLFDTIGVVTGAASGSSPKVTWNGLVDSQRYDWYVIVSDGVNEITSPIKTFVFTDTTTTPPPTAVGKKEFHTLSLDLFPNPNDGKNITINYPETVAATVSIFDAAGRKVYEDDITLGNHVTLPVRLNAGTYVMQVITDGKKINKKLIVQ